MSAQTTFFSSIKAAPCPSAGVEASTVYIVEDDADLREVLAWTLTTAGHRTVACDSGARALEVVTPKHPGCVLIDLCLPDMSGLELRTRLLANRCRHPFIVLTGSQDIALAVQSLQNGAVDFLQKPFDRRRLLQRVEQAIERDRSRRRIEGAMDALTDREREVLHLLADGGSTKEMAHRLAISPRTVDVHRHNILKKMGTQSLPQLIRVLNHYQQLDACGPTML